MCVVLYEVIGYWGSEKVVDPMISRWKPVKVGRLLEPCPSCARIIAERGLRALLCSSPSPLLRTDSRLLLLQTDSRLLRGTVRLTQACREVWFCDDSFGFLELCGWNAIAVDIGA